MKTRPASYRERHAGTDDYRGMIVRCLRRYGRLAQDEGVDTTTLGQLAQVQQALDDVRAAVVLQLRAEGYSWASIGRELGVTAEAARVRYTVRAGVEDAPTAMKPGGQPGHRR